MMAGFWQRQVRKAAFRKANAARDERRWADAARHYRRYLRYRPGDFAIWVQLGHVLAESGELDAAHNAYCTAHALDPDDADLALCRGHLARRGGDIDAAIGHYRRSLELDGNEHAARAIAELTRCEPPPGPATAAAEDAAEAEPGIATAGAVETQDQAVEISGAAGMPSPEHDRAEEPKPDADGAVEARSPGALDGWYERTVSGVLSRDVSAESLVEFRTAAKVVGSAAPVRREDGVLAFRAMLDIDPQEEGEAIEVSAYLMPEDTLLAPGPVTLYPPFREKAASVAETAPAPMAGTVIGGLLDGWYQRSVSGVLHEGGGAEPWVEFRSHGRTVGRAIPQRRDDGALAFRALLDVELGENGEGVEVSAWRMPDNAPLEPAQVTLFPPSRHPADHPAAWSVPVEIVKPFDLAAGGEIALFVTHSGSGKIKPHVLPYLRALKAEGIGIFLVATVDRPVDLSSEMIELSDAAMVRRNAGYDFGAWAHALRLFPRLYGADILYLLNDSVLPATADGRISAVLGRVRRSGADLVGLTESHEWRWHVQSYFLAIKARLLSSRAFHGFMDDLRLLTRKDHVIRAYETRLAEMAEQNGHAVEILFPSATAINPTLFGWRELIAAGMPFVKLLLLRGEFERADISDWRQLLQQAGFDVPLVEASLAAAAEEGPVDDGGRLLARRIPAADDSGAKLRVAFYGPWNYDNGLGQASRGIIGAIRRTGVRLNLHPIRKPFHVHRPLAPPTDIIDFEGPADIALVHLNPDSWHLLTEDQRAGIAAARRRIGYWVWEMGHLPPAWQREFCSVDRIWAPSRYCAELFAAQGTAPVDIVPHVVPVTDPASGELAGRAACADAPAGGRMILYIFDGSSYLVRKNPGALVRSFSASGLAARGWSLVLKTKHLLDRPEEGSAFRDLVSSTDGAVLIDRSMSSHELGQLVAAADIYASPHCSEGFGLTIAEAMAAGKAVVATDFGGSRDFLDAETGWPVKWHNWRLEQGYGHYSQGGEWARIDEPALTATLLRAADAVEAGDRRKGQAARVRIAAQLSYDAVAASAAASFAAAMEVGKTDGNGHLAASLDLGIPADRAVLASPLHLVLLGTDGALDEPLSDALPKGQDEWIVLVPRDGFLSPLFERDWREAAAERPDVGIFYGDDLALGEAQGLDQLRLKPAFDLTLLAAQDYIGAPVIVRASLFAAIGLREGMGAAAIDDMLLRAHHAGVSIERIPRVLLARTGARPQVDPALRHRMLEAQPLFAHYSFAEGRAPGSLVQQRRFDVLPEVTLVVPTRRSMIPGAGKTHVEQLLKAIAQADWPMDRLSVIVGDDVVGEADWAHESWPFTLRRIETPRAAGEPFNYAAKMNRLWRLATSEHIVLMNDDLLPSGSGWLKALIGFTMDDGVGGVGARLLYPDGRLQHAGIAPLFGAIAHAWAERRQVGGSYQHWALVQREWSMVTGALFATRRSVLEAIDGFDEQFTLEYNDIDMCLRIRALGFRIICTPEAEMTHAERASRGDMPATGDQYALFRKRWAGWLDNDPSWHPGLRRDRFEVQPADDPGAWYR